MKRLYLAVAVVLAGCTGTSSALLTDAQLIDETLTTLVPLLPPADQIIASALLSTVSTNITALQGNGETPVTFVSVIQADLQNTLPNLLKDVGANSEIALVITALSNLGLQLAQETSGQPPAAPAPTMAMAKPDPRPTLQAFVASHHKSLLQRVFGG